jgi:hypothetical protein
VRLATVHSWLAVVEAHLALVFHFLSCVGLNIERRIFLSLSISLSLFFSLNCAIRRFLGFLVMPRGSLYFNRELKMEAQDLSKVIYKWHDRAALIFRFLKPF